MTDPLFLIFTIAVLLAGIGIGIVARDTWHLYHNRPENIITYVKKTWPDEYAAYHKGVDEGYQRGLADCRNEKDIDK